MRSHCVPECVAATCASSLMMLTAVKPISCQTHADMCPSAVTACGSSCQGQPVWPRACRSDICTDNTLWKKAVTAVRHAGEPGSRAAEGILLPLKRPHVYPTVLTTC